MKGLARRAVWWPQMDKRLRNSQKLCGMPGDRYTRSSTATPSLGISGKTVAETASRLCWSLRWENVPSRGGRSHQKLRSIIARFGIPEQIISDNVPRFTSEVFRQFIKINGIHHATGAPYHPATNGIAERLVQSFKKAMKADKSARTPQHKLDKFLFAYRCAPHDTTEQSPAELVFGRNLRTKLGLIKPDVRRTVEKHQLQNEDRPFRESQPGEPVMARNYRTGPTWVAGEIEDQTDPVSCTVRVQEGCLAAAHRTVETGAHPKTGRRNTGNNLPTQTRPTQLETM